MATCLALLGCTGGSENSSDAVTALELADAGELPRPDVIGVVSRSVLERDGSLPVHYDGTLELEGARVIQINDATRRVVGCRQTWLDDPDGTGYVFDYSGCLAIARTNDDGVALDLQLLDPIDARVENLGTGWVFFGSPTAVGDDVIVFRELFPDHPTALSYQVGVEPMRQEFLDFHNDCEGHLGGSMVLVVDDNGTVVSIAGYGEPSDFPWMQIWDRPCGGPNTNI